MVQILKYNSLEIAKNIEFCRTLPGQVLGLMFRKQIPEDFAMIFVLEKPSSIGIHMLFMRFPIDVIFLNKEKRIAGLAQLKPWTGHKAMKDIKYIIETNPGTIGKYEISIGGQMDFEDI